MRDFSFRAPPEPIFFEKNFACRTFFFAVSKLRQSGICGDLANVSRAAVQHRDGRRESVSRDRLASKRSSLAFTCSPIALFREASVISKKNNKLKSGRRMTRIAPRRES
jgi:hypothetical protein